MSIFSELLGDVFGIGPDAPEKKAIGEQQRLAKEQKEMFGTLFETFGTQRGQAFQEALGDITRGGQVARGRLGTQVAGAQRSLQDLFTAQRGQFQGLLSDVMTSGRQQAARSGLIGGSQEAALVNPAIERLTQQFGTQAAQAQLDLQQQALGLGAGLERQILGARTGLFGERLGQAGRLQQGALAGRGGAGQQQISTAGIYPSSLFEKLGQILSGTGSAVLGGKEIGLF